MYQTLRAFDLDFETPLLCYVIKGELLRRDPELVKGFANASRAAKKLLMTDDAEWDRLRPKVNAKNDAQFAALKEGFHAGIPEGLSIDEAAADWMLKLMV